MRKMKDSGIEWIGKIPYDWECKRCKYITSFINGYPFESEKLVNEYTYPVVRISDIHDGCVSFEDCLGVTDNSGLDNYKIRKNDILLAMSGATVGKVGIALSSYLAYINQRVGIIRTKEPSFLFRCLSTNQFIEYVLLMSAGTAQPNVSTKGFGDFFVPYPPLLEQKKIADFLDGKCADIDQIRADIEKQIEILTDYKKSVITEAVTKGLNPKAKLKDSCIEWIGKIPEGWITKKLKYLTNQPLQYGANESGCDYDDSLPRYIRITDISMDNKLKDEGKLSLEYDKAKPYLLEDYDLLFARSGASVGKTFLYKKEYGTSAFAGYLIKASLDKKKVSPKFVYYNTLSCCYESWKQQAFTQATIQNIGAEKYNTFVIPVPPLPEQKAIADYLDEKCSAIDATIADKQRQLETLDEYKKSLIFEYVTGKKEVLT